MEIIFNNQTHAIIHASLQIVLNELVGEKQKGIAVAVNDTVVPKSEWPNYLLQHNDHLIVIKATPGG